MPMHTVFYESFKTIFATLYPAYSSYKAVKSKNAKEYVKWMMYWISFAFFLGTETITDIFLTWLPFYNEIKFALLIWMLSPLTKGSSIVYRKFLLPQLSRRESDIDSCIEVASKNGCRSLKCFVYRSFYLLSHLVLAITDKEHAKRLKRNSKSNLNSDEEIKEMEYDDVDENVTLRRQDSYDSAVSDDVMNAILEASYQQEMKEAENNENVLPVKHQQEDVN